MAKEVTVDSIISKIKEGQGSTDESQSNTEKVSPASSVQKKKEKNLSVRGLPKSGRFWKSQKEKFSTINKTKGLRLDFEKKTALRLELKRIKELSKQAKEEQKEKILAKKERRRDNLKRTEENRKKAEVVQVITNTAKLKRMRKKQLRFIEKRDTTKVVEASK